VTLVSAADESARWLAWTEASNIGDLTLEQMHSEVRWIARSYLKVPTLPLFARARAIRDQAFTLLAGHQRPDQSRDLYAAAGWALTVLAWISTDLGRPDAADIHARAAWVCADNADHHGLRAWIRATQHTAAFWEHHFLDAAGYAEDGLRYATTGSPKRFWPAPRRWTWRRPARPTMPALRWPAHVTPPSSSSKHATNWPGRSPARWNERVAFGRTCISRSASPSTR
jgi:hypothetical protein